MNSIDHYWEYLRGYAEGQLKQMLSGPVHLMSVVDAERQVLTLHAGLEAGFSTSPLALAKIDSQPITREMIEANRAREAVDMFVVMVRTLYALKQSKELTTKDIAEEMSRQDAEVIAAIAKL